MSIFFKPELFDALKALYSEERVLKNIEALVALEKPRGYSAFKNSTAWCEEKLKEAGFSDVRRIAHKADGETAAYDFIMPQAWDLCARSTLSIVEPFSEMIADTDVSTMHVSEYAAPTPEGGVTAELVDYNTLDPEKPDCKGKFVFYRGYVPDTHPMYTTLAGSGCAGLVYAAFNTIEHAPDSTSWNNGHGHIGWYHLKEDPVMPVFCVTPKVGIKLIDLLSKGSVVLHGEMNTRLYDGEIYTVTATIPGKSEDEFAILAHMYEPFASDDSQGFAVGLEVGIMLKKLIDDGVLPKPEKTLRLIFSMERYGFGAFFANHDKKVLASLSIDTLTCLATEVLNMGVTFKESPVVCPFFGDMLFYEAMKTFCPEIKWVFNPGNMSDDCWQAEPTVDIPTNWLVSGCGYGRGDYHHCDAPIFDGVVPYLLKKLVPMVALYSAVIVCGDREHYVKMANELEKTAARFLEERKNYLAGKAATGKFKKNEAMYHRRAAEMLYLGRMASFNRFFDGVYTPKLPALDKAPVSVPHFPTVESAFVFRALEFFSYEKIAAMLGTTAENIKELGDLMGIYKDEKRDIWIKKGYITIIRAVWHLLPYDQLTELLEVDADELAILLREEDFLDIKLGKKPVCERLSWKPITDDDKAVLAKIKATMDTLTLESKEPFEFDYIMPDVELSGKENFGARIIYCFSGLYQKCLDVDSTEYCPDELLESYRRVGVNGIYIQGVLYLLTEFPFNKELSKGWEMRLANLKKFTERCEKFGIKIYLYINEPRSMNAAFFEKHPHIKGHVMNEGHICMCTSTKEVRDYVSNALETICRAAPKLGGFICMCKSENLTNCYSHVRENGLTNCPRCKTRTIGEVIGELFHAIREGVDRVDPAMKVFDFSWDGDSLDIRFDVIDHLPERVIVESICESKIEYEIGGVPNILTDYSLNILGPGERSLAMWKRAKERGLETASKVQINTTWECSTIPALPVLDKVDTLMTRLREADVNHVQLSWTLGGYPSMNLLYACKYFFENAEIPEISENMKKATTLFSEAFSEFPSNGGFAVIRTSPKLILQIYYTIL